MNYENEQSRENGRENKEHNGKDSTYQETTYLITFKEILNNFHMMHTHIPLLLLLS